ncbi:MAG: glycosyltransferase [Prevotellaceae bacterium]|jgi:glycosyltransferase involved in cell wall biosynthesis|nr:glycosyltransferase [Prevotellaceae bacterium]
MIIEDKNIVKKPVVSVIVLTYNQENLLKQCLDSIISQKCNFTYELIIGEDCSTDTTRNICKKYQEQNPAIIKLLLQETNQGLMKNFVDLLSLCRGKYIAHCAGDDYWCDDLKLQKQYDYLENNSDFGFVRTGFYHLYNKKGLVVGTGYSNEIGWVFNDDAKYGTVAAAATIFFKRNLLKYLDLDEFVKRKFSIEDYPMQAILAKYTKFGYISDVTAVFRQTTDSGSRPQSSQGRIRYVEGYIAVKKYLKELFPVECNFDDIEMNDYIVYAKLKEAYRHFSYKEAKKLASELQSYTYKQKKLYLKTSNIFVFYLMCIFFNFKF